MKLFQGLQLGKKNVLSISCIYMNNFFIFGCRVLPTAQFVLVVKFINSYWDPTCSIVVILEVQNTTSATLANFFLIHD
jgi:hypothetical protein